MRRFLVMAGAATAVAGVAIGVIRSRGASAKGWRARLTLATTGLPSGPLGWLSARTMALGHGPIYAAMAGELDLQPDDDVLDVGCGCGQLVVPLSRYLDGRASYEGFDVDPVSITWASRHLAPAYPNLRFRLADVFNTHYNPRGTQRASAYRFPYEDASFDVVIAKSVCTHLLPAETEHYIRESARVLRPGGRCWLTFFLLNEESSSLIEAGRSTLALGVVRDRYRLSNEERPEAAVAIDEALVDAYLEQAELVVRRPHVYGNWCGRRSETGYQDVIVAAKPRRE